MDSRTVSHPCFRPTPKERPQSERLSNPRMTSDRERKRKFSLLRDREDRRDRLQDQVLVDGNIEHQPPRPEPGLRRLHLRLGKMKGSQEKPRIKHIDTLTGRREVESKEVVRLYRYTEYGAGKRSDPTEVSYGKRSRSSATPRRTARIGSSPPARRLLVGKIVRSSRSQLGQ